MGYAQSKPAHRLSGVDEGARTAVCEICGPTAIRVRQQTPGGKQERGRYECRAVWRRWRGRGKRYKLTPVEYKTMAEQQGGVCAICHKPPSSDDALFVDHDHGTGAVRGLLCRGCNSALGWLLDDPQLCLKAAEYLLSRGE